MRSAACIVFFFGIQEGFFCGRKRRQMVRWFAGVLAMAALSAGVAAQQLAQTSELPVDLTTVSIEDLRNIQLTSASKKVESTPDEFFLPIGRVCPDVVPKRL
jgi:hypothetical protein